MQARARLLQEWDKEKMALGQEADEGAGSQVRNQLQMIGLRQQVDATRKEFDEASAQIRRLQKQNNTLLQRRASSQKALGDDMERIHDKFQLRLKRQKEAAQKKQALTKDQLAHVREAKRQEHDSFEARITYLETQITAKERQHAQDIKGMAVKVDEAHANATKGQSSLQKALERADVWKAKALQAEARKQEAEKQAARLEVEVANLREMQDADKRKVSCPFRPCRFVSSTDGAATCA